MKGHAAVTIGDRSADFENLRLEMGNFGELFGVVRQVAGDTLGMVRGSLVTAQEPAREQRAESLAQVRGVPSVEEAATVAKTRRPPANSAWRRPASSKSSHAGARPSVMSGRRK